MELQTQDTIIHNTNKLMEEIEEEWNRPDKQQDSFMIHKLIDYVKNECQGQNSFTPSLILFTYQCSFYEQHNYYDYAIRTIGIKTNDDIKKFIETIGLQNDGFDINDIETLRVAIMKIGDAMLSIWDMYEKYMPKDDNELINEFITNSGNILCNGSAIQSERIDNLNKYLDLFYSRIRLTNTPLLLNIIYRNLPKLRGHIENFYKLVNNLYIYHPDISRDIMNIVKKSHLDAQTTETIKEIVENYKNNKKMNVLNLFNELTPYLDNDYFVEYLRKFMTGTNLNKRELSIIFNILDQVKPPETPNPTLTNLINKSISQLKGGDQYTMHHMYSINKNAYMILE